MAVKGKCRIRGRDLIHNGEQEIQRSRFSHSMPLHVPLSFPYRYSELPGECSAASSCHTLFH